MAVRERLTDVSRRCLPAFGGGEWAQPPRYRPVRAWSSEEPDLVHRSAGL